MKGKMMSQQMEMGKELVDLKAQKEMKHMVPAFGTVALRYVKGSGGGHTAVLRRDKKTTGVDDRPAWRPEQTAQKEASVLLKKDLNL